MRRNNLLGLSVVIFVITALVVNDAYFRGNYFFLDDGIITEPSTLKPRFEIETLDASIKQDGSVFQFNWTGIISIGNGIKTSVEGIQIDSYNITNQNFPFDLNSTKTKLILLTRTNDTVESRMYTLILIYFSIELNISVLYSIGVFFQLIDF